MEDLPRRKLPRLRGYDYSQNGYYFITICTHDRKDLLCTVGNAVPGVPIPMIPTRIGNIVLSAWKRMACVDPYIDTDAFCMMPNHIHGIICIDYPMQCEAAERRGRRSLPELVRAFKSATTRAYNRIAAAGEKNMLWQSSYYDEIIRNASHLDAVRSYIDGNPARWAEDEYYTDE